MTDENVLPRRCCMNLMTPAELAILHAQGEVEMVGADVRLTNALCKLQEARNLVADYIDNVKG